MTKIKNFTKNRIIQGAVPFSLSEERKEEEGYIVETMMRSVIYDLNEDSLYFPVLDMDDYAEGLKNNTLKTLKKSKKEEAHYFKVDENYMMEYFRVREKDIDKLKEYLNNIKISGEEYLKNKTKK